MLVELSYPKPPKVKRRKQKIDKRQKIDGKKDRQIEKIEIDREDR